MSKFFNCGLLVVMSFATLTPMLGCRGYPSPDPPVHPLPNMDWQEKGRPYRRSDFFADGQYMRPAIEGTVARGMLEEDEHFHTGKINGKLADYVPSSFKVDEEFLNEGQQKYMVFCSSCHGAGGDGAGLVGRRLVVPPTSFHSEYMYGQPVGHFVDVIKNGIRNMRPYDDQIDARSRWQIAAFLAALQMSQDFDGAWIKRRVSSWKQQ